MIDQEKTHRIKSILNKTWNPIGISLSEDDDEYDIYVKNIVSRAWTEKELRDYLMRAESHNMGLEIDAARKQKIASAVHALMEIVG